jgi:hypothetical protein
MTMRALDLCCGLGGWTEGLLAVGWSVFGVDIVPMRYPGQMMIADVRSLPANALPGPFQLVVASPPCLEFSRWDQPFFDKSKLAQPDTAIWRSCERIARELGAPLVLENVRGAQRFMGRAAWGWDGAYLWGDGVPLLRPVGCGRLTGRKRYGPKDPQLRAKVPYELARWIADYHREPR